MIAKELTVRGWPYEFDYPEEVREKYRCYALGLLKCQYDPDICPECPIVYDCVRVAVNRYIEAVGSEN